MEQLAIKDKILTYELFWLYNTYPKILSSEKNLPCKIGQEGQNLQMKDIEYVSWTAHRITILIPIVLSYLTLRVGPNYSGPI